MGLTDPYCPCPLYITPLQISVSKKVLTSYMQGWATVCPSYGSPILVAMALIPLKNVEKSWPVNLLLAPLVFLPHCKSLCEYAICTYDVSELFFFSPCAGEQCGLQSKLFSQSCQQRHR